MQLVTSKLTFKQFPVIICTLWLLVCCVYSMLIPPPRYCKRGKTKHLGFYLCISCEPHLINITASFQMSKCFLSACDVPESERINSVRRFSRHVWRGAWWVWLSPTNDCDCFCIDSVSNAPNHIIKTLSSFQTRPTPASCVQPTGGMRLFFLLLNQFYLKLFCLLIKLSWWMVSWLQTPPKCTKTCCSAWATLWNATTLGIHGDEGNTFILKPISEPTNQPECSETATDPWWYFH